MSERHLTEQPFSSLGLSKELMQGIEDEGFIYCTPIQAKTLPLTLQGRDVAGQAQTGTGKTAAFLLAAMHHLLESPPAPTHTTGQPRALIVAPTRELAIQIHRDALALGKHTGFQFALAYGGTGYESQREHIAAGVDILIGTPGRLIDYYKQRVYTLNGAQVVILDEADRMFDLGFIRDVRYLLRRCPKPEERLGMLFSATLSYRVTELAYEHMNNPVLIEVLAEQVTADRVEQVLYHTSNEEKIPLLIGLLRRMDARRSIVFVNTKRGGERVCAYLQGNSIEAAILSGDVPQQKRQALLRQFQEGDLAVLVATDVAARGLHIPEVSHIFNYDLPQDAEDYVHRIGRTARLGARGDAISFACETFVYSLPEIEEYIGMKIPVAAVPEDALVNPDPPRPRRPKRRGAPQAVKGQRPGKRRAQRSGR